MNNCQIDNSLIYEILKFINDAPNGITTLRDIVDNTTLSDYASGNTAISQISNMGLLAAHAKDGVVAVTLDSRGCGKLFIDNYKYVSKLTARDKHKERFCGFAFGVLTALVAAYLLSFLGIQ